MKYPDYTNENSEYVLAIRKWLISNIEDFKLTEEDRESLTDLLWDLPDVVVGSIWQHAFLQNCHHDYTLEEICRDFRKN